MNIMNFTDDELKEKLEKMLDEKNKIKWQNASKRIQKERRIESVVDKIVNYLDKL